VKYEFMSDILCCLILSAFATALGLPKNALGDVPISDCGTYQISGLFRCDKQGTCSLITHPGGQSETAIELGQKSTGPAPYDGLWVAGKVLVFASKPSPQGVILDQPTVIAPDYSAKAVQLIQKKRCSK
jgi:hypothetical protein